MARYLLDSDVLIWVLRNRQETVALLDRLARDSGETLACSALSVLEIWVGARPSETPATAALLDAMEILPVDRVVAQRAAELLRPHTSRRDPREWVDAAIAATVLQHHLVLVTYNQRDYPYPQLSLYPLPA